MKALVLTDTWKSKLSKGDHITDSDYPVDVILRASKSGYIVVLDNEKTAKELREEAKEQGISGYSSMRKSELKEALYVEQVERSESKADDGESQ